MYTDPVSVRARPRPSASSALDPCHPCSSVANAFIPAAKARAFCHGLTQMYTDPVSVRARPRPSASSALDPCHPCSSVANAFIPAAKARAFCHGLTQMYTDPVSVRARPRPSASSALDPCHPCSSVADAFDQSRPAVITRPTRHPTPSSFRGHRRRSRRWNPESARGHRPGVRWADERQIPGSVPMKPERPRDDEGQARRRVSRSVRSAHGRPMRPRAQNARYDVSSSRDQPGGLEPEVHLSLAGKATASCHGCTRMHTDSILTRDCCSLSVSSVCIRGQCVHSGGEGKSGLPRIDTDVHGSCFGPCPSASIRVQCS